MNYKHIQVTEGGAPKSVEPTDMSKRHPIAEDGTPYPSINEYSTFNPCLVLLGLHIQVPKREYYCQRTKRCINHREKHPEEKQDTKLEFVKSWEVQSPRSNNTVKVEIWKCPRCGRNVRKYPHRREQTK